jgi:hypothetical protein
VIVVRYIVFGAVGIAIAVLLSYMLNAAITVTHEESVGFFEGWIKRALCDKYELSGVVTDTQGAPIPFALVEVVYLDQRLSTRSRGDGDYRLVGDHKTCEERPEVVSVYVSADDFRAKRRVLDFAESTFDVILDRNDF